MATLVSPGVSISVIDQSIGVSAGQGTVPLIIIATASNKTDASGLTVAQGTLPQYAGKLWDITSQRDLVQTFGEPNFYSVSGTPLNGYPLNEYGLLAAYSYLGLANLARVVRADIDLSQLGPSTAEPTSPATVGTLWFNQMAAPAGSQYGLFKFEVVSGVNTWVSVPIKHIFNSDVPTATAGVVGDHAITFFEGLISYYTKVDIGAGVLEWSQIGGPTITVEFNSVWPDADDAAVTDYWVKTSSGANGANIVLEVFDATANGFVQVECPLFIDKAINTGTPALPVIVNYTADEQAADYYGGLENIVGQYYLAGVPTGLVDPSVVTSAPLATQLQFKIGTSSYDITSQTTTYAWIPLTEIEGSSTVPTNGPEVGQIWFNSLTGLNDDGTSTVDVLVNNGIGAWTNINLSGFTRIPNAAAVPPITDNPNYPYIPAAPWLYIQSQDPRNTLSNNPRVLQTGDLWLVTDIVDAYPVISRYNSATQAWTLVDNTDQTTPNGILFSDARPSPEFFANGTDSTGQNNSGGTNPDLDPDAPNADEYPKGFLLWNTRYSTNVVKKWVAPFFANGELAAPYGAGGTGRWVNISGNRNNGSPYMGSFSQEIAVVHALNETIASNEDIRAEDTFYNLIATPGYVGCIQAMVSLNEDRKETAFVVGDSPMQLNPSGTSLQRWATNAANAANNSLEGLVTQSRFLGVWYPSGLTVNPTDGADVVVPPSHMALHTIAYSDQVAYPWFAPAGLQRGIVTSAASVGYVSEEGEFTVVRLNEGQRDILYNNGINPIRIMPTGGVVIYGQKDRQPFASALDRINVVRLENYLRYQFNELAQPWLFEPNDATTRDAVQNAFTNFLSELITLRALYDFLVVCDLSNNTPARIDRNELWIDVAIQPVRAIEFIYIPLRIKNTGASLSV